MDGFKKALGMSDSVKRTVGSRVQSESGLAEGSMFKWKGMTPSIAILLREGPQT